MHYGHLDVFDRIFHITRGGISKASRIINISEDIYAGFNSTLRQGNITHHEYIQVGKGRDVGLNQTTMESWEAWWDEEHAHICSLRGRIFEALLSLRFFIFQYGIVYKIHAT